MWRYSEVALSALRFSSCPVALSIGSKHFKGTLHQICFTKSEKADSTIRLHVLLPAEYQNATSQSKIS